MALWREKRSRKWRYEFQVAGTRYTASGFATKTEAKGAMEGHRKQVKNGKQTQAAMGFKELASIYLDYAERRFAKKTYKYKVYVYKSFLAYYGDIPVNEISPQHIINYLNTRNSNNNYNVHRKDLSALFSYAQKQLQIIDKNPCQAVDKMPHSSREKRMLSEQDILKLVLATDPQTDERDLLLVVLHTLARIDEILRLTWKDVNFEKRIVTKWTRKRKGGAYQPIIVSMNNDLYDILWNRWRIRQQNEWVFYNEKTKTRFNHRPKFMKGLCKRAGIDPPFGFHDLRHFMATLLNDSRKVTTRTIQEILGHTNLKTTEIYLHSRDRNHEEAMQELEGRFAVK